MIIAIAIAAVSLHSNGRAYAFSEV